MFIPFFVLAGCGSGQDSGSFGVLGSGGAAGTAGSIGAGEPGGSGTDSGSDGAGGAGGAPPLPQSGQLTAGIWDDNANFEHFEAYRDGLWSEEEIQETDYRLFSVAEQEAAHAESVSPQVSPTHLDVALVIDTTGSMSDEIRYLQSEFRDLATAIGETYPSAVVRWALVVYRDRGDAYVVQHDDFTNDAERFRSSLGRRSAGGGGDYPEAPEVAFERANQLGWRGENDTAKLAFWVADAPPHVANLSAFASSIRGVRDQQVAVYPVASSGVDENTEYFMRASAQLTGGRYIFITNDSGIGGDHKAPSIPCYYVTLLRDAILRAVDAEMTGEHTLPRDDQVIRSVGEPDASGICQLDQTTAQAF